MLKREKGKDRHGNRREIFEKSLSLSLGLFLLAMLSWQSLEISAYQKMERPPIFEVQNIPETRHRQQPPPPPRPAVPVETEGEDVPENVEIESTELDDVIDVPPPLPPEEPPSHEFWWAEEMPELIQYAEPYYPEIAQKAGLECDVILSILVDETGHPAKVKVTKSCGNTGFNEAAVEAAWKCKFTPGKQNDKPVKVWVAIPFRFRLN